MSGRSRRARSSAGVAVAALLAVVGPGASAADPPPRVAVAQLEWVTSQAPQPGLSIEVALREPAPCDPASPDDVLLPRSGRAVLGCATIAFLADAGTRPPRVWMDSDLDGELRDETPLTPGTTSANEATGEIVLPRGTDPPLHVPVRLRLESDVGKIHVVPQAHRRGRVVVAGRVREIALVDGNANLLFDDCGADVLWIDVDGDARITWAFDSHERFVVGETIPLGGGGWMASVLDPSGATVELGEFARSAPSRPRVWRPSPRPAHPELDAVPRDERAALQLGYDYELARSQPQGPTRELMRRAAKDAVPYVRAQALRDLRYLDDARTQDLAVAAVPQAIDDRDLTDAVADVLAAEPDATAARALLQFADGPSVRRERVAKRMSLIREPAAIGVVIDALAADSALTRRFAIEVLALIPDPLAIEPLGARVVKEPDPALQLALLDALAARADVRAIPGLVDAARSANEVVRRGALRSLVRGWPGHPEVADLLARTIAQGAWGDVVVALDAVAKAGAVDLARACFGGLAHERWQVRLTAVEMVGTLRVRESVDPMIDRMPHESNPRVREALGRSLFAITGVNLYDDAKLWHQWRVDGSAMQGSGGPAVGTREEGPNPYARGRATFYGVAIATDGVAFVLDRSGSMEYSGGKETRSRYQLVVDEFRKVVTGMPDKTKVNLILFNDRVREWSARAKPLNESRRRELLGFASAANPSGSTNLFDALDKALEDEDVDTIVLLSDGQPTDGRITDTDDILREVARRNEIARIRIHCIAVDGDMGFLRALAEQNDGDYVLVR